MKCRLYQGPLDGFETEIGNNPPPRKVFTSRDWPMVPVWQGEKFLWCKNRFVGAIKATYELERVNLAGTALWRWRP